MKPQRNLPDSDLPCIKAENIERLSGQVSHGFFGRRGGLSAGVYESLNCGLGSGDNPDDVKANRVFVASALGVPPERLITLYQVHGRRCLRVHEKWDYSQRQQADALVTDLPGIGLGVLTADCVPVLFHGQKKDGAHVIGAVHAGWRGAQEGVLISTVERMVETGAVLDSLQAAVGPCIQKRSYEVGEEFYRGFLGMDESLERFFISSASPERYMFDLPGFCAMRLAEAGVENTLMTHEDTYTNEKDYFSFRRTTHRQEHDYGRQISAIAIL